MVTEDTQSDINQRLDIIEAHLRDIKSSTVSKNELVNFKEDLIAALRGTDLLSQRTTYFATPNKMISSSVAIEAPLQSIPIDIDEGAPFVLDSDKTVASTITMRGYLWRIIAIMLFIGILLYLLACLL